MVVVAHRLATVQNADVIFVVGDGRVVERGSHAELLRKREGYYQMVRLLLVVRCCGWVVANLVDSVNRRRLMGRFRLRSSKRSLVYIARGCLLERDCVDSRRSVVHIGRSFGVVLGLIFCSQFRECFSRTWSIGPYRNYKTT
jgi:hypothetical protein